ncbi:MAG TPA: D-alanyl-D-alanine carboxypeptidase family protein, partial [Micavibrio sp.]|nr:D-alanyl-D-alanine carboxypeptidase family protein [Micavibrio sp.]
MVLRRIVLAMLMLCMALAYPAEGMAKSKKKQGDESNNKYASIVVDAETGAILSQRYPDKRLHPASLTKVMTLLLLFEALDAGNVRLNDKIQISRHAANAQPSKLGLTPGSSIRVEDAILAVVTKSANDIATAIAEHLAGSESRFALRMTRRARDIGMSKTTFKNAHGLHNPGQVTSARDMATLARYVLVRYPNYYRYFGTKQFTYRGKTYTNHNRLMNTYPGMDGFKTGFINASGFNLIASAKHGNKRLIGVVFGGRSWKSRNDHMASLLNTGFEHAGETRYAGASLNEVAARASRAAPAPVPPLKPVFRETETTRQPVATALLDGVPYTSLAALDQNRKPIAV